MDKLLLLFQPLTKYLVFITIGVVVAAGITIWTLNAQLDSRLGEIQKLSAELATAQAQEDLAQASNGLLEQAVEDCNREVAGLEAEASQRQLDTQVAIKLAEREIWSWRRKFEFLQTDLSKLPEAEVCRATDKLVRKYLEGRVQ